MPTSWIEAIPEILDEISHFKPDSVLDIGIGFGKYGVLLREKFELHKKRYSKEDWKVRIDGIEAFPNYRNPIHDYVYNHIYYETVEDCIDHLPMYDVILMIDVLEHFEKEKGRAIVRKILQHTNKAVVISTPLYPAEQGGYLSNKYEEHKSRWLQIDFAEFDFDYKLLSPIFKNGAQIFVLYPSKEAESFPFDGIMLSEPDKERRPLTIAYFLPHKKMTGGLKMLLEQMKHLRKNGHKIHAFFRGDGDLALPEWFNLEVDKEIIIPNGQSFLDSLEGCDVGVAGWLDQMEELADAPIPVVYWEQGNAYLFGEIPDSNFREYLRGCYQQTVALTCVSPIISKILFARFGRKAHVIPNGIDTDFYYPVERPNENVILLVGNPKLMFKGFDVALTVLIRLYQSGQKFKVKWVCQTEPSIAKHPIPFPIEYIVMPSQEKLAECYRKADVFLFTSWYEGFGMPPLEAMASGLPVVATSCGGIDVYAKNHWNALLVEPGNVEGLVKAVTILLNSKKARDALAMAGQETALKFASNKMIGHLENYLYRLVSFIEKFRP